MNVDLLRKLALSGLLGSAGVAASATEAEAGSRSDALKLLAKRILYHGGPELEGGVAKTAKQLGQGANDAFYLAEHPAIASPYAEQAAMETGTGLTHQFQLPDDMKYLYRRPQGSSSQNAHFAEEEAQALRDKGYDAIVDLPSKRNPHFLSRMLEEPLATHDGSIAVLNPDKLKYLGPLGVAGLTTAGVLSADESEAMPLGELAQLGKKALTDSARSPNSFYNLEGLKLSIKGIAHTVEDVVKGHVGKKEWYKLVLRNPEGELSELPMTKDYIDVLNKAKGAKDIIKKFNESDYQGKKYQGLKSLTMRENIRENGPIQGERDFEWFNQAQAGKVNDIDPGLVQDYVYVKSQGTDKNIYMPRVYAEFLAKKGHVEIVKQGPGEHLPDTKRVYDFKMDKDEAILNRWEAKNAKKEELLVDEDAAATKNNLDLIKKMAVGGPEERELLKKIYETSKKQGIDVGELLSTIRQKLAPNWWKGKK